MDTKKTYTVLGDFPLKFDDEDYLEGDTIKMTEKQAVPLIALGRLKAPTEDEIKAAADKKSEDEKKAAAEKKAEDEKKPKPKK
ncbi:MAG: hypothetical protein HQ494_08860 [Rhodospirillales bacterium]|nr:hypothetical protein [Rhodospirillales bacterium]